MYSHRYIAIIQIIQVKNHTQKLQRQQYLSTFWSSESGNDSHDIERCVTVSRGSSKAKFYSRKNWPLMPSLYLGNLSLSFSVSYLFIQS